MAVELRLPRTHPIGVVRFAWSPLLEASLSLRPVVAPKRYPMHLPWARRSRDLPASLLDEIRVLTLGFPGPLPGVFEAGLLGPSPRLDDELEELLTLDPARVLYEMALCFGGHGCAPRDSDPTIVDDPVFRDTVVRHASTVDPEHGQALATAFHDPAAYQQRIAAMLSSYWEHAFRTEWERVQGRIEQEVAEGARTLMTAGVGALIEAFLPEGRWDADTTSIVVDKPWRQTCDIEERGSITFVPSVYAWPGVLIELAEPWLTAVILPLRSLRQPEVPLASDREVADGLRALGDETRLQIARLVAEQPRSTKELATLLNLSESSVSRHLKTLAAANVVESARDGYFVLYRLVPTRIGSIGASLRRTLGLAAGGGPVPALPVSISREPEFR